MAMWWKSVGQRIPKLFYLSLTHILTCTCFILCGTSSSLMRSIFFGGGFDKSKLHVSSNLCHAGLLAPAADPPHPQLFYSFCGSVTSATVIMWLGSKTDSVKDEKTKAFTIKHNIHPTPDDTSILLEFLVHTFPPL